MKNHSSHRFKIQLTQIVILLSVFCFLFSLGYAKEITILYTGSTHAMLYPCSCPKEPDGGVARRATLIKDLRKNNPETLVLDSGSFFAGGLLDEYTQNTELDKARTLVNLKAMELMQYDALNIGDDEFNFGSEFLQEVMAKSNLVFLSCNIQSEKFLPYIIKEIAGTKFGVIGLTKISTAQKAQGLKLVEHKLAVKQAVEKLKKEAVDIIILLSQLDDNEWTMLIEEVKDIDILLVGYSHNRNEPASKIGSTIVIRPSWQGRRLCRLSLTVENNKIMAHKVEELRLSDKISDDPQILSVLPACFSDINCKKQGFMGQCLDAGTLNSRCVFNEPAKINLLIITPKSCSVCETDRIVNYLKTLFPGLSVSYLYYPNRKTSKLISDLGIKGLPAYLLGKEIEKENSFTNLQANLEIKDNFYLLKPQVFGIAYFLNREKVKGKLDLFINLYDKDTPALLEIIKEFNPTLHFLAVRQKDAFDAQRGTLEVEEYLRSVCVKKYYPQEFWDYITCRVGAINSSWWQDCLREEDASKIKTCAQGEEGKVLLEENIRLNKELEIMFGPTYVLDNVEVFSSRGVPKKEELEKIIKR